jgi:hypothetical protein
MGVAKLGIPVRGRAAADRISDRIGFGVGLRRHPARHPYNAGANDARITSSPQFDHADRHRLDHFCWSGSFSFAPSLSPQIGKVDRGLALPKFER